MERGLAVLVRGAVGRAAREESLAGTPRLSAGPWQPPNSTPYFRETLEGSLSAVSRPISHIFFLEMGVFASCFRDLQDGDFIELRKLTKCHQNVLYFFTEINRFLKHVFIS